MFSGLNGKTQLHFHLFIILRIYDFHVFGHFSCFVKVTFLIKFTFCHYIVIRPYAHRRENESNVWWFSPLFDCVSFIVLFESVSCRGDSQERRCNLSTLILPSLNRNVFVVLRVVISRCRGDYTGSIIVNTLVLPSLNRFRFIMPVVLFNSCRGDSQERSNFVTLVLPTMNRNFHFI